MCMEWYEHYEWRATFEESWHDVQPVLICDALQNGQNINASRIHNHKIEEIFYIFLSSNCCKSACLFYDTRFIQQDDHIAV